ncbi:Guanine nucleotide-binding protein subunit gamma 2-like protein [Drosera capensis]
MNQIDARGKHRIYAELKRLEQDASLMQAEMEQLGKMEPASAVCKELLAHVQTRPDPLLLVTNGPLHPSWDRWFEGPEDSRSCRCSIT